MAISNAGPNAPASAAAGAGSARRAFLLGAAAVAVAALVAPASAQTAGQGLSTAGAASPGPAPAPAQDPETTYRAVLDRYCVACHNERTLTGNLALDNVDIAHVGDAAEDVGEGPREGADAGDAAPAAPPAGGTRRTTGSPAGWRPSSTAPPRRAPIQGRPTIHRLNRLEYANAVRDLLGLSVDVDTMLPADDLAYGFDNNADILTIAPGMLERYLSAARRIGRLAVGDSAIEPDVVRYPVSSLLVQRDRMSEEMPFGSRGGAAVTHHFPLDGEYVVRLTLLGNGGRREPQEIDVRVDGVRAALLRAGNGAGGGATRGMPTGDGSLAVRVPVRAGTRVVSVSFLKRTAVTEGVAPDRLPVWTFSTGRGYVEPMALESVGIEGPYRPEPPDRAGSAGRGAGETASREHIFTCWPHGPRDEAACADEILAVLARRAFRRPVTGDDLEGAALLLRGGTARGRLRRGDPAGDREPARRPGVPLPDRARPRKRGAGKPLSPERRRVGLAPVVLPLEQHSRRRAPRCRRGGAAPRSGRPRAAGATDAGRPAIASARRQLRRAVVAPAPDAHGDTGRPGVPGVRRQPARRAGAGDRALRREPDARGPQRRRSS